MFVSVSLWALDCLLKSPDRGTTAVTHIYAQTAKPSCGINFSMVVLLPLFMLSKIWTAFGPKIFFPDVKHSLVQ